MTAIQCRCGAVHVELSGDPIAQFFCHCDDCRAVHGGAYVPVAMFSADTVNVARGTPRAWQLKTMPRMWCPECGTRLFADPAGMGVRGINGLLLPKAMFKPSFHMNCHFAMRPVRDNLPHYKGFPSQFGGTDEKVAW